MDPDLPELEQEFRQSWHEYEPARYASFLSRTSGNSRIELLTRMLSAELEFFFQPPTRVLQRIAVDDLAMSEEDERVRPCVQLFALRFPELLQHQEQMLRLIVLEYALRLRHDRIPPNADSYFDFCQDATERLIGLLELTESKLHGVRADPIAESSVDKNQSTIRESEASPSITLAPLPYNLGCFLLIRMIGHGGMGYVHAAIDLRSTAQVALKVMRRVDAWSVYRFIEEFSWLSQLNHPNLVRLYDAFSDGDVRYFSMELVEGRTIRDWFRRLPTTSETRWQSLRKVLSQLASAIEFLHLRGVVHRDIKCSNVMITPRRRAVLLDLGLAVRHGESLAPPITLDGERLVGTLQYMAPEGLCGAPLSLASDWYSFGVLMYEVLVDEYPPIRVDLAAEKVEQKYSADVELLRRNLSACPPELARLCIDLLNCAPERRPSGAEVLRALGNQPIVDAPTINSLAFHGRENDLLELNQALNDLGQQVSSLLVLRGVSGLGKTALVQHWMQQIGPAEALVFPLRCFRQDHTPLRLLNMLVQCLVHSLSSLPENLWREAVEESVKLIGHTFPQIQQLLPGMPARTAGSLDPTNSAARRDASLRALSGLLTRLSSYKPIVIVVDDAHCADADSLKSLCNLLSEHKGFHGLIVLVDLADQGAALDQLVGHQPIQAIRQINLEPLGEGVCQQLLRKWATEAGTRLSPAVQADFFQRSGGNPFLLLELFRAFQHVSRGGEFNEERWLCAVALEQNFRRFSQLPIQAENVLQYLAVADQPIGFHQLQMVSRIVPHELQRTLSYLNSQGWIRNQGENLDSEVEISNESFRKLVVESLPIERLHRRHFRMARILSGETPPPWPRIAHHYWRAEKYREAAACYMEAARVAAHDSAFDEALYFLSRAFHPEADRSEQEQFNAQKLRADSLAGLGSSVDAARLYEELGQATAGNGDTTLIECLAGEQWIRAGQLDKGLDLLRGALRVLGFVQSRKSWPALIRFRLRALTTNIRGRAAAHETSALPSFSLLEQSLTRVSTPLTFLDNQLGPELILRLDEIAATRGSLFDQAQILVRSGIILSLGGRRWRNRALQRLRLGRGLARRTRVDSSQATAYFCMYVWSMQRGAHCKARNYATKALALYERGHQSAQWEMQFLHWGILACYWSANRLHELRASTAELRASAEHRADPMSLYWMNVNAAVWSDLSEHKLEHAREALQVAAHAIANQPFQSPHFFLWHSRVLLAAYEEDWRAAQELLANDWSKLAHSLVLRGNHYLWLALSARICVNLLSHRMSPHPPRRSPSLWLRDARRCVVQMKGLEDRVFVHFANAFFLVVEAAAGRVSEQARWQDLVDQLHALDHHQMAYALQWHQSLVAPASEAARLRQSAEQGFREAGCAEPRRLLNIILPLP